MAGIFRYNTTSSTPMRRQTYSPFCSSPGQLQDVTMECSYAIGYRSPSVTLPHGGNISPGQGRSVREFEEQMTALRKENFNLKLRIYFLEEKITGHSSSNNNQDGQATLFKQNVDLKVDIEVLRKELQEKQTLLCEAAKAMELMEKQQKVTEEQSQVIIDELHEKIRYLETENKELEKVPTGQHTLDQLMGRTEIGSDIDTVQKIRELEGFVKKYEEKTEEFVKKISEMEAIISQKQDTVNNLENKVKQLEYQNSEIQEQLDFKTQEVVNTEHQKLKEELIDYKKRLADKICTLEEVELKLKQKTKDHEKACTAIQKLIFNVKSLELENEKLREVDVSTKNKEDNREQVNGSALKQSLSDTNLNCEWNSVKEKLEKPTEKDVEIKKLKQEVKKKTSNLQNLINIELWEKNRKIERLTRLLNKSNTGGTTVSSISNSPLREIEQLKQSFTDSEYNAALEQNKNLQRRIDALIQKLGSIAENNTDSLIHQLQIELQQARENADKANSWRKECTDVCEILKDRLEELAGFLDTLLEDEVLGALAADRKRAMRKAVNRSLEMSRSLNNMSLSRSRLSLGEQSLIQLSSISGLLNITENKENQAFNFYAEDQNALIVIENLKAEVKALKKELDRKKTLESVRKERKSLPVNLDIQSESEAWSEPDRKVSLARIGLEESQLNKSVSGNTKDENIQSTTESESDLARKLKSKNQKKIETLEKMITERDNRLLEVQLELVETDNKLKKENLHVIEVTRELGEYKKVNEMIEIEIARFKSEEEDWKKLKLEYEDMKKQIREKEVYMEKMQQERDNLNIEMRVAEMKVETLKKDIEDIKLKHAKEIEATIEQEQQKLKKIEAEIVERWEEKLKCQEASFHSTLSRDWISRTTYNEIKKDVESAQRRLVDAQNTIEFLCENESELNKQLIENEKAVRVLKKNLDDATLQASKAALERTKAMNEKLQLEGKLKEITTKLETVKKEKSELMLRLAQVEKSNSLMYTKSMINNSNHPGKIRSKSANGSEGSHSGYTSEDMPMGSNAQRHNSSSDLGIESDVGRTSSVEMTPAQEVPNTNGNVQKEDDKNQLKQDDKNSASNNLNMIHDCVKIEHENEELRRKLRYTKHSLENTWNKLRVANQRKEQIERDLRQQILKTQKVLKNVRTNLESELEQPKKEF